MRGCGQMSVHVIRLRSAHSLLQVCGSNGGESILRRDVMEWDGVGWGGMKYVTYGVCIGCVYVRHVRSLYDLLCCGGHVVTVGASI